MHAITADSFPPRPGHGLLYLTLVLSVLMHVVFVAPGLSPGALKTKDSGTSGLSVRLKRAATPPPIVERDRAETAPLPEIAPAKTDLVRPEPPASSVSGQKEASASAAPERPRLDRAAIRAVIEAYSTPDTSLESFTDTGAVVLDPTLRAQLNASERRVAAGPDTTTQGADFSGGNWVDMVNIDGKCFRVVRANPLEPVSHDTWYRTSCK